MFQGGTSSHHSEHFGVVTPSIGFFPHDLKLYRVLLICCITGRGASGSVFVDRPHDSEAELALIRIAQVQNIIHLASWVVVRGAFFEGHQYLEGYAEPLGHSTYREEARSLLGTLDLAPKFT